MAGRHPATTRAEHRFVVKDGADGAPFIAREFLRGPELPVLAAATGLLLFSTRPLAYAENPAFLAKLGLVGLGVLNALALNRNRHWRQAVDGAEAHASVRLAALASLLVWVGAVVAGRWIGFLQ